MHLISEAKFGNDSLLSSYRRNTNVQFFKRQKQRNQQSKVKNIQRNSGTVFFLTLNHVQNFTAYLLFKFQRFKMGRNTCCA